MEKLKKNKYKEEKELLIIIRKNKEMDYSLSTNTF